MSEYNCTCPVFQRVVYNETGCLMEVVLDIGIAETLQPGQTGRMEAVPVLFQICLQPCPFFIVVTVHGAEFSAFDHKRAASEIIAYCRKIAYPRINAQNPVLLQGNAGVSRISPGIFITKSQLDTVSAHFDRNLPDFFRMKMSQVKASLKL